MGYHYGDIGAMLMANWNLSDNLQSITRLQPTPDLATEYKIETALMHLAHACAQSITTENQAAADTLIDAEVQAVTGLTQEELEHSMDEARSISAEMEKVILA
jgi:HD-like signal output (HDOD) protein